MAEYKAWIETHSQVEIRQANSARSTLRKMQKADLKSIGTLAPKRLRPLNDHRAPLRSRNAYTIFLTERYATGDMKGISISEAGKLIAKEFAALSASEKKVRQLNHVSCVC